MATTQQQKALWADTPFKLIETPSFTRPLNKSPYSVFIASEMAHVHNALLRGLNAIYNQAPHIPPSDPQTVKDYLFYARCWLDTTHHHHDGEEKVFFPGIETLAGKPGLMSTNIEQHHAFHAGFEALQAYVTAPATATAYSGAEMQRIIDSFAPVFTQHLTEEIDTLMALGDVDEKKLKALWQELETYALDCDKYTAFPLIFSAIDGGYEGGMHRGKFPPVPWFVPYLVKYWYGRRHERSWRFGPCDGLGARRELVFV